MTIALCDALIFTGEAMVDGHALILNAGKVADIVANRNAPADAEKVSCGGQILAPGFIDAQVNGGRNILFNTTPTPEACITIAEAHAKWGTTRILPTVITDTPEVTAKAVAAARTARKTNPGILGIHIEGPHLGSEKRGVHKADYLRALTDFDIKVYRREGDEVMLVTLAPENVTPEQIKKLKQQGTFVSIGHTSAKPDSIRAALAAGATGFTHLFNGMGTLSARDPGPAGTALDDRTSWCGLIADGYHVGAEMIRLALRAKPRGKIFLVSDAMPPAASDTLKSYQLYGETIMPDVDGRCFNKDGRYAGSAATLADGVKHCTKIGVELEEALRMASAYPAAFLGLDKTLGKLLPGYAADIVALDKEFKPKAVWRAGKAIV